MGFFSGLKKAVKGIGKIAQKAAPALAFIPGVGLPLAAGIGAAGGLIGGGGVEGALKGAAGGALGEAAQATGALGKIGGAASRFFGGGDGFDIGDAGRIAGVALPAIAGFQGMRQAGRDSQMARDLTQRSVDITEEERQRALQEFQANAGLRDAFRNIAMNFGDPTNPFTRTLAQLGGDPTQQAAPQQQAASTPAGTVNDAVQSEMANQADGGQLGEGLGGIVGQAIALARQQEAERQAAAAAAAPPMATPANQGSGIHEFLPNLRTA
jgi:hypothetical protein